MNGQNSRSFAKPLHDEPDRTQSLDQCVAAQADRNGPGESLPANWTIRLAM